MRILIACLAILLSLGHTYAQGSVIKGQIIDQQTKVPIVGAVVSTENGNETLTNAQGEFELTVDDSYQSLTVSATGFGTQTIYLGGQTTLTLSLESNLSKPTANVLSSRQLGNQPVTDLEQSAQGRAAGVFIQNSGGKLGQGAQVRIRGGSSLTGSNEPLYVVDGVPLTSGNQSDIDPSTIESMEILKDAAATAIYGSRAANGVVLITTKKGNSGFHADVELQYGISETPKKLDMMSADDYRLLFFEYTLRALIAGIPVDGAGISQTNLASFISEENLDLWYTDLVDRRDAAIAANDDQVNYTFSSGDQLTLSTDNPIFRNTYNTDWQDLAFRRGDSKRATVNLSGGSAKQNVMLNVNYLNQEGILIGNDFERFGSRLNLNSNWSDRISSNISFGYAHTDNNQVNEDGNDGNPVQMVLLPPGDAPDPDNNYVLQVRSSEYNPQTEIYGSTYFETTDRINSNASVAVKLTEELSLNLDGGLDLLDLSNERRQGPATQEGTPNGLSQLATAKVTNYLFNGALNYHKSLGDNNLTALAGTAYQSSQSDYSYRSARINSVQDLKDLDENDPSLQKLLIPGSAFKFLSFFGSVRYDILGKYAFTLNARADGSTKVSESNQFGVFPALSFSWILSNENFLSAIPSVSSLQLNLSAGLIGNTPEDDFLYRTNYFNVIYGDQEGYRLSNLANSGLKWESTRQFDFSLSYGLFDNRVSGSLGGYYKDTYDLLFPVPVSQISGQSSVTDNAGEMVNLGIEFDITGVILRQSNFTWDASFNISHNKNEIKEIGERPLISGNNAFIEGESAGVFYMPKYLGVDPITGDALYDRGDGTPTSDYDLAVSDGRQVVGNPNPKFYGGLTNNISYQQFNLNFMFQFVQGIDLYWESGEIIDNSGFGLYNQTNDQRDRWYAIGDDAKYPRLNPAAETPNPSSRWIVDGSYIRLKTVTLSYNIPVRFGTLSVYIGGQNLLTFSDYPGYDPDVSYSDPSGGSLAANINRGIAFFTAPQPRIYTTGIKIGI